MPKFDKCLIIHGCPLNEQSVLPKSKRWMNWLEDKLKEKGFNAVAPDMPTPWEPKYEEWKKKLESYPVTENTLLVAHSCGAAFLVHWLLETHTKVKKLILVAPAKVPESENDLRKDLYAFDLPDHPTKVAEETIIYISNDLERHLKSAEMYRIALGAKVIELPNKGHFLIFTMGTNEFPELFEEVTAYQVLI